MCGLICNCYLNDFNSKETGVYDYFFQGLANPCELILLFGTPILLHKVNDFIVQVKIIIMLC